MPLYYSRWRRWGIKFVPVLMTELNGTLLPRLSCTKVITAYYLSGKADLLNQYVLWLAVNVSATTVLGVRSTSFEPALLIKG